MQRVCICLTLAACVVAQEEAPELSSSANRSLRIAAVFIILGAGALGVTLPFIVGTSSKAVQWVFKILTAAGAGVILGTGFIHMLPGALQRLNKAFQSMDYPFGELIVMATVLFLSVLESELRVIFGHSDAGHSHSLAPDPADETTPTLDETLLTSESRSPMDSPTQIESPVKPSVNESISVHIMEIGIAIHSVIIGIALGALRQYDEIRTLLIAITLHQALEGFALGATIYKSNIRNRLHLVLLCALFAFTTPIGVAIGIGISSTYNEESQNTLISEGVLDAVSAGVLLYTALVNIVADIFTKNKHDPHLLRLLTYFAYFVGAGLMAVIGIWA